MTTLGANNKQTPVEILADVFDKGRRDARSSLATANDGMLSLRHPLREALIRRWNGPALKRDEAVDGVLDEMFRGVREKVTP